MRRPSGCSGPSLTRPLYQMIAWTFGAFVMATGILVPLHSNLCFASTPLSWTSATNAFAFDTLDDPMPQFRIRFDGRTSFRLELHLLINGICEEASFKNFGHSRITVLGFRCRAKQAAHHAKVLLDMTMKSWDANYQNSSSSALAIELWCNVAPSAWQHSVTKASQGSSVMIWYGFGMPSTCVFY